MKWKHENKLFPIHLMLWNIFFFIIVYDYYKNDFPGSSAGKESA